MDSKKIRDNFFNFFESKQHKLIPSASLIVKNDPTLMFTNAGMNQYKNIFLENSKSSYRRIVNSQKCLRVSGKHNDLEEVGIDTYHHTFFEMLGNWSFGDYFKKEAIIWSWELLTKVYKINSENLYVTFFEGSNEDKLNADFETKELWENILPKNRIIKGSKKDNFWEMGQSGPCGPCSEIHIDLRNEIEKEKVPAINLINNDHPEVIELWNLVFIQFNRLSDGKLISLKNKYVDTGMGFERLSMVLQNKKSTYDIDIFIPIISQIESVTKCKYGKSKEIDIAIRVISDHIRSVFFSISDGQLPSNNGPGYVIRRILRRAIRYGHTFLNQNSPFLHKILPIIAKIYSDYFPRLTSQITLVTKVVKEEEISFLKTLQQGLSILEDFMRTEKSNTISGENVFKLYDTYGFPKDLTALIAKENNMLIDEIEFESFMKIQQNRSRSVSKKIVSDWITLSDGEHSIFEGYNSLTEEVFVRKYRRVSVGNKKDLYHIILDKTPFYPEGGGQIGDSGILEFGNKKINVINTIKENDSIIHIAEESPEIFLKRVRALVNKERRFLTSINHSCTHILHNALRNILGDHVNQRGSMVNSKILRFDFSHFSKISESEIKKIEDHVNKMINEKIKMVEKINIPIKDALNQGAIALFDEKYGDKVRVIKFGDSIELCGGTHVNNSFEIKNFKIISESSIASGVRRIEALTENKVLNYLSKKEVVLNNALKLLKNPTNLIDSISSLYDENIKLKKEIKEFNLLKVNQLKLNLINNIVENKKLKIVIKKVQLSPNLLKDLVFKIGDEIENIFILLVSEYNNRAYIVCYISKKLVKDDFNASIIIKNLSTLIDGKGGGQNFFATAGGDNIKGINDTIVMAKKMLDLN